MLSHFSRVQLFVTPWSVHGILQARILEWIAIPFSRGSSWPRDRTQVSHIAGRHFNLWATSVRWVQLCGSLSILWHCFTLGLEWKLTFSSPVATAELFQILRDDAMEVLHSICQQIWKTIAVATGLEKVSFHSNPKEVQCQRLFKLPYNCTHFKLSMILVEL